MTLAPPRTARPGVLTLLAVHLMILPTGASQALYGPSLPAIVGRFDVATSTAGLLLGAHGLGAVAGIGAWALLQRVLGMRRFAAAAGVALAGGSLLLAFAPTWQLMVAGAVLTGLGFGGNASGLNVYVTRLMGFGAAPVLTSLAAIFGVGSILAPALLGWVGLAAHPVVFAAVGASALAASPLLLLGQEAAPAPATPRGDRRPSPVALLFMLALACYVALEVGVGGWAATHLITEGHSPAAAARWTAGFWGAFTAGRFLATPLALRVRPRSMALASITAGAVALTLAVIGGLAPVAYVLAGLALAPLFPALFAWYTRVTGTSSYLAALFFLAGSIGAALLPPLIGLIADVAGPRGIPVSLAAVALAATAILARLRSLSDAAGGMMRAGADSSAGDATRS